MKINEIDKTFVHGPGQNSVVACLKSILQYFEISVTQYEMKEKIVLEDDKGSATLADIATAFERFGLIAEGFRADAVSNLDELTNPAIIPVYMDDGHEDFAVYYGKYEGKYLIGMPFWGLNLYHDWEFEAFWVDHIILIINNL